MQTIKITTSQNIDIDYEVAGLGERIVARLLDMLLFILVLILGIILGAFLAKKVDSRIMVFIMIGIYAVLFVFYDLGCELWMNGQSFGKRVMKIKVISLNGARPTLGQYLLRWLFRIVDFTLSSQLCALICVAVSEKKQRLGDMVAGTTLIKTRPKVLIDNLVFEPVADDYKPVYYEATQLKDNDIVLLKEVIQIYVETGNSVVVYNAATQIKELLSIKPMDGMDDLSFLQTLVKDYTHLITANDLPVNS